MWNNISPSWCSIENQAEQQQLIFDGPANDFEPLQFLPNIPVLQPPKPPQIDMLSPLMSRKQLRELFHHQSNEKEIPVYEFSQEFDYSYDDSKEEAVRVAVEISDKGKKLLTKLVGGYGQVYVEIDSMSFDYDLENVAATLVAIVSVANDDRLLGSMKINLDLTHFELGADTLAISMASIGDMEVEEPIGGETFVYSFVKEVLLSLINEGLRQAYRTVSRELANDITQEELNYVSNFFQVLEFEIDINEKNIKANCIVLK